MQDNIAKRSLHYVLPYGIATNVVRIFYIRKEKGKYLHIKTKKELLPQKYSRFLQQQTINSLYEVTFFSFFLDMRHFIRNFAAKYAALFIEICCKT